MKERYDWVANALWLNAEGSGFNPVAVALKGPHWCLGGQLVRHTLDKSLWVASLPYCIRGIVYGAKTKKILKTLSNGLLNFVTKRQVQKQHTFP